MSSYVIDARYISRPACVSKDAPVYDVAKCPRCGGQVPMFSVYHAPLYGGMDRIADYQYIGKCQSPECGMIVYGSDD